MCKNNLVGSYHSTLFARHTQESEYSHFVGDKHRLLELIGLSIQLTKPREGKLDNTYVVKNITPAGFFCRRVTKNGERVKPNAVHVDIIVRITKWDKCIGMAEAFEVIDFQAWPSHAHPEVARAA